MINCYECENNYIAGNFSITRNLILYLCKNCINSKYKKAKIVNEEIKKEDN